MDIFIILCFVSVFCTLIEFAFINFIDVFIRRLKMKDIEQAMIMKVEETFYHFHFLSSSLSKPSPALQKYQEMTHSMTAPLVDSSIFEQGSQTNTSDFIRLFLYPCCSLSITGIHMSHSPCSQFNQLSSLLFPGNRTGYSTRQFSHNDEPVKHTQIIFYHDYTFFSHQFLINCEDGRRMRPRTRP